ncbi:MAG: hypothetical protein JO023_02485 [Chloroflexi bacterium]|nr:hypothetical protein [Chloroflexota bacterium]
MSISSYLFSETELARLATYRQAVRAGFFHEGWGTNDRHQPVEARVSFARLLGHDQVAHWRGLMRDASDHFAAALADLGVRHERVYLQDTPAGGLVFICSRVCALGGQVTSSFDERLLAIHHLLPGSPGPSGVARLILEWSAPARF